MQGSRRAIANSFSPENHALYVWDNLVAPCTHLRSVYLLTHGNGSSLAVDIAKFRVLIRITIVIVSCCQFRYNARWFVVQRIRMNRCASGRLRASNHPSLLTVESPGGIMCEAAVVRVGDSQVQMNEALNVMLSRAGCGYKGRSQGIGTGL